MLVACFDIGGTAIKSALIGDDKEIRERQEIATPATLEELLEWMRYQKLNKKNRF